MSKIEEMRRGFETAYIDGNVVSDISYRPQFVSNDYKKGKKVLSSIEDELMSCDRFQISVAFITLGGIEPLLLTLKELEKRNIRGEILTTNYLNFSEPKALEKLNELKNITLKMYDVEAASEGFHTKGYIFKKDEIYRIIIGSSNITKLALTSNREWNTRLVSTNQGEMVKGIVEEFNDLWNSKYSLEYEDFYENYREKYNIIKRQREIARRDSVTSIEKYKLQPNSMQVGFIQNLKKIINKGNDRALLISATGTGKTYASAFAMRELGFKRVLFLVHRVQLARQTKKSYERVFGKNVSMGLVGAGYKDYDADFVFAMVPTLNRDEHLLMYKPNAFDCIIIDEAHHVSASTYQKIMNYFTPKLWLGMTATPDKRDDDIEDRNVYHIFNYQIAYEIRLQQAMEEKLLCPFHYFGISDISTVSDSQLRSSHMTVSDFALLTSDERVRHIIDQANYYGYSGNRVKGLVFCSRIDESKALSEKYNNSINPMTGKYFRTIALNGDATEEERQIAFERLAMDEESKDGITPLDYIFSVEILNEGVDIVEVNQVIMLRPTESPIVFIQQLGRGLRRAEGKEFVVILDFIGNYNNNFMIPIALSGNRNYNPDTIRKYVISGNNTIPGASTVHFDEIAKEKIFSSVDKIRGIKTIIKNSYITLKNRLGRVPYLIDFYESGEVEPLLIVKEYKTYQKFLESAEGEHYIGAISEDENTVLEYLSKTILNGERPYELEILQKILQSDSIEYEKFDKEFIEKYGYSIDMTTFNSAVDVLQGKFVTNASELEKYSSIDIVKYDSNKYLRRLMPFSDRISHDDEFRKQLQDIVKVGLRRFNDMYIDSLGNDRPFVMYEKYSRRDVCFLMNCEKDLSSTMYGMKRIGDDAFIFITYHKVTSTDQEYVDGKPDYADVFDDNVTFRWDSQIGRGIDSSYVTEVRTAKHKHLMVKKSDAENSYYYMGEFDIENVAPDKKRDNKGKMRDITKFKFRLKRAVRDDLLRYLQSNITTE